MMGVSQTVSAIATVSETVSVSVVSQTVAVSVSETVSASVVSQSVAVVGIGISLWLGIGGPLGDVDDSGRVGDITAGGGVSSGNGGDGGGSVSSDMDGGRGGVGGDSVVAESVVSQTVAVVGIGIGLRLGRNKCHKGNQNSYLHVLSS